MRLIKFESKRGPAWINPEFVDTVSAAPEEGWTCITYTGDASNQGIVKGNPEEVVKALLGRKG